MDDVQYNVTRWQRVVVVGTTGCGKTTLARQLSLLLGIPHVELDAIHWGPGWTPAPLEVFRARTAQVLSGSRWVADGNYGKVQDIVWGRAEVVVWLDYDLPVLMGRLLWRTLRRIVTGEELWSGNRESIRDQFFTGDSLLLYALRSYRRRRREYPQFFAQPCYAHLSVVRLRSPRATRHWLRHLRLASDEYPGPSS
jgi:adenylate kinase family enzyme